ncbi:hypothetical protein ACSV9I_19000 [Rhizobium sp. G187]|nr:hypothetical protein [Rhizobium sp. AAP43]
MSYADIKRGNEHRNWRAVEACQSRIAMIVAAVSIGFLAVLIVTL